MMTRIATPTLRKSVSKHKDSTLVPWAAERCKRWVKVPTSTVRRTPFGRKQHDIPLQVSPGPTVTAMSVSGKSQSDRQHLVQARDTQMLHAVIILCCKVYVKACGRV